MNKGYNIKAKDWKYVLDEWEDSIEFLCDQMRESFKKKHKKESASKSISSASAKSKDVKCVDVLYEIKKAATAKARFFIVNEGIEGQWGFWCPKSAIIEYKSQKVGSAPVLVIKDWVTIHEIEWNEY